MIVVETVETRSNFEKIAPAWERLYERQSDPAPFLHWHWFDAFWSAMEFGGRRPVILVARQGDELLGAAPMQFGVCRFGGMRCTVGWGMENAHSPEFRWLLSPDAVEAASATREILHALARLLGRRHAIKWNNTPGDHPATRTIVKMLEEEGYRWRLKPSRYPSLLSLPENESPVLTSLSSNMRSRLRKGLNRLERSGDVRFEQVAGSSGLETQLDAAWRLEKQSWKGRAGSAVALDGATRRFYDGLASKLAPMGKVVLFMLWSGDVLVAFLYGLLERGVVYGLKFSYNSDFAHTSPGYLIVWKILEWGACRGVTAFHFGGRESPFKTHWKGKPRAIASLHAFPKGLDGSYMYMTDVGWKDLAGLIPGARALKRRLLR